MIMTTHLTCWFLTGSQGLYGPETLAQVEQQSRALVDQLNDADDLPVPVEWQPVLTESGSIHKIIMAANADPDCVGLITWMHTFSPAKMWIAGLDAATTPFLHLHTQFNREIPWADIDMDFMNLNQAAHGDREFGFIAARLRLERKVVMGHWSERGSRRTIGTWSRAACARADWQTGRIARIGDNMREVAVTEGDKVEAQLRFGVSMNTYGVGDLVDAGRGRCGRRGRRLLVTQYRDAYEVVRRAAPGGDSRTVARDGARIELGCAGS